MIIAFESLFSGQYSGGANWLEVTLRALADLPDPPTCIVVSGGREPLPEGLRRFDHIRSEPLGDLAGRPSMPNRIIRKLTHRHWEDPRITAIDAMHGVDLWVGFCGFSGLGAHRRLVAWYPDFQCRHLPQLFTTDEIRGRERQWNYLVDRADGILVISQSVAMDAIDSHPTVADRLHIVPFAPNIDADALSLKPDDVRRKYGLPEQFFIVSNQFWEHKNHHLVIAALASLRQRGAEPPVVAFTGRPYDYRQPEYFSKLLQHVHESGVHTYCRFLGQLPRAEQVALVRSSSGVIQPSLFEGRGAIAEEASVLGVRVFCSDIPVHHELELPRVEFFSVYDPEPLALLLKQESESAPRSTVEILVAADAQLGVYGRRLQEVFGQVVRTAEASASLVSWGTRR